MRLLIEIPDEMYKTVQDGTYCGSLYEELKNGIPQETVTEFADRCRECGKRYTKRQTGHWIETDEWRETVDGFEQWGYFRKCSKCGYVFKFLEIDKFCPNCGARMAESEV